MKTTSSQRWAIGAVALAVLIACSPKAPEEPAQPDPNAPTLSENAAGGLTTSPLPGPAPQTPAPGFAGVWAASEAECTTAGNVYKLSPRSIERAASDVNCAVRSISEEQPTGRSMIYTVAADCVTEGAASQDTFRFEFGAADTIMQLRHNDLAPERVVRCP